MRAAVVAIALLLVLAPAASAPAGEDPEVRALVKVLQDPAKGTAEKGDACLRLMEMPERARAAVPALIPLLAAADAELRDFAITTLKTIGPGAAAALPALRRVAAEDPAPEIRELAADAVAAIGGKADEPAGGEEGVPSPPPRPPRAHPLPAPRRRSATTRRR